MLGASNNENFLIKELLHSTCFADIASVIPIVLDEGQALVEKGARIQQVYFPTNSVVSRIYHASCGHTAEMGMVGNEGIVGISLFMGDDIARNEAVVHVGGPALRMQAAVALKVFEQNPSFHAALLRYVRAMTSQISQVAVCNSLHPIEQRLCRWLLMTFDRTTSKELHLSHYFIAQMLAVRRESITAALSHLRFEGLIRNSSHQIEILDRSGMEAVSCECYRVIRDAYSRLILG